MSLDLYHIPNNALREYKFLTASANTTEWQSFTFPRGASMVTMICIGAGAGGGAGFSGSGSTNRGGGAGGGSGAISRLIIPRMFLPNTIFLNVGIGGTGGASNGVNGNPGARSYISVAPNTTLANLILVSGAADAGGGNFGSIVGNNTGGIASTIFVGTSAPFCNIGHFVSIAGMAGGNSGALGSPGSSVTALASIPLTGGAGAGSTTGGVNQAGGNITAGGILPSVAGGTIPGGRGGDGTLLWKPFCASGGAGGATGDNTIGGNGGWGAIGCGGGGAGAGISGTFPVAGRGGDGAIFIIIS